MKVPRSFIGKRVDIRWKDPIAYSRVPLSKAPKGNAALAEWTEHGLIDDITEGVVRIVHSAGRNAGEDQDDEVGFTVVPEELIVELTPWMLEPKEGNGTV